MTLPEVLAPTVAIARSDDRFPVRRIVCVGPNYADHAREMGSDSARLAADGMTLPFPSLTRDLHHEVERVVALNTGGANIAPPDVARSIFGHAVEMNLTRRDPQAEAKKA